MSYLKKLQTSIDQRFQKYLPDDNFLNDINLKYCANDSMHHDAQALMDAFTAKESA
jgi:hypothetical protein